MGRIQPRPPKKRVQFLLLLLLCTAPGIAKEATSPLPGPGDTVEVLPDMKVKGTVECSFGFGVTMFRQSGTMKVLRLFVAKMSKDSPAAQRGLKSGDEILSLDGKKVRGMDSEARQGGELFTLLCNRPAGDTIAVEVVMHDQVQRLTLTAVQPSTPGKARRR